MAVNKGRGRSQSLGCNNQTASTWRLGWILSPEWFFYLQIFILYFY